VHHVHSLQQFLFCVFLLLHSPPCFTHESPSHNNHNNSNSNNNPISSLYRVLIASVHLVHAMCAIPLHTHTAPISSTSRVLCLIIMVTLQLLWRFSHAFNITGCYAEIPQPLWQLRLFVFSGIVELILSVSVTGSNPHPAVNFLHESSSFHWQIPCNSSAPLEITQKSLRILW
jgi:hypothetical protein